MNVIEEIESRPQSYIDIAKENYKEGYNAGYEHGFNSGYSKGRAESSEIVFERGYKLGRHNLSEERQYTLKTDHKASHEL